MIRRIPLPVTGVMLGMAALGNLLQSYSEGVRLVCGVVAAVTGLLVLLKVILYPKQFAEDMKNPVIASVSGTFTMALMLLALVTYRYMKHRKMPEPVQPLFCIYTAPASLCLAGYIQSVQPKSIIMVGFLAVLSTLIYVVVLLRLPRFLKMKFYPSYSAFTFPFVITAIGMKMTMACLANMGSPMPFLQYVVLIETVIAAVLTIYALICYIMSVCIRPGEQKTAGIKTAT